jgi:polysaccharide export outer membrane protein
MSHRLYFLFLSCLALVGCVANRKIVYLQSQDINRSVTTDVVVRTYEPVPFDYKIQPNDALYIRFESLTPEEYNFFTFAEPAGAASASGGNIQLRSELVNSRGEISFAVVGPVKVAGLTVFQVQDTLQSIANTYLKSPIVK